METEAFGAGLDMVMDLEETLEQGPGCSFAI